MLSLRELARELVRPLLSVLLLMDQIRSLSYDYLTKIKYLDDSRIKGNRIANPLFQIGFPQVNCGTDKQTLLILRNFSATKIKVNSKKACLGPRKIESKVVLTDSDHLRKKCGN